MISKSIRSVAADSNVLLSAVAGKAARRVFERAPELVVVTTEENYVEVEEYLPEFAARYATDAALLLEILALLPIRKYGEHEYASRVKEARTYVEQRDPDDVPLAALALLLDVPIWSNDNDFDALPVVVYTTAKLLRILGI